ncbi:GAP1-N2 domain-containing protein [Actinomadura litoris]|uniref:Uncharacterized protein n=1 Tax=Actinomadura litoris TaxID=2678616 RepID=A0A7K1KW52_9ACTN|nr:hypothetical protein [Actinomadura litoris]MUN36420.1 hypothetical protein [Actinomadura litoris]
MAWQLHYTSARHGPTGRAGFQFVAETPGLPDGVRAGVTPYLSYRPPPDAPLSPDEAELAEFPVSLLYDTVGGRPLLLRSRYLGRDYSGRYGNFFAHAVVAEPGELEGLRPAELWRAPLWTHGPADDPALEELEELTPGAALDPEALAAWLAAPGSDAPYATLAGLVDAVSSVLARGHGRVVLVAGDVEVVARWIAVVSYSLPVAAAARLSFVTYTADPEGAAQRLVGTTPGVWAAVRHRTSHAFAVDLGEGAPPEAPRGPSRFARTVAACWRAADFAGLDALAELARPDTAALDGAAVLLALCRGEAAVTAEEERAAAELVSHRDALPDWVWRELAPGARSMGLELALAVHRRAGAGRGFADALAVAATRAALARPGAADLPAVHAACPAEVRDALLDGVVAGLTEHGHRDLDPAACDLLYASAERLRGHPDVAVAVLASAGRRRPATRVAVTGELLGLAEEAEGVGAALGEVWTDPPSALECVELLEAHPAGMAAHPALAELPSRAFARQGETFADAMTLRLAARVLAVLPDGRAARDAEAVRAHADAVTAEQPREAARALDELAGSGAGPDLADAAFTAAARLLCRRPPRFRAALLAAASTPVRARLGGRWTAELPARARAGRAPLRGAEIGERNDLVEVVLRLRTRGVTEPALETWARAAAGRWLAARQLDAHLSGEPRLRAALKDLLAEAGSRFRGR